MKSLIVAGAASLLSVHAANAQVEVVLETRIVAQTITGSGAAREIANATSNVFESGSRVRLTMQYRLLDQMNGTRGNLYGPAAFSFSLNGTNANGNGVLSRSALTTDGTNMGNGENGALNNAYGWTTGPQYPQSGTSANTGLHEPFRFLLNGNDNAAANGNIQGGSIGRITMMQIGGAAIVNQTAGTWWGAYSFEFQANAGFTGSVDFNVSTQHTTMGLFRGPNTAAAPYKLLTENQCRYVMGGITLQFAPLNTAPTATVINRTIAADPFASDANALVLATFADATPGSTIDVAITNDGGIGALGGVVSIIDDNTETPSIVLNWDAPNAAIGQTFTVSFVYIGENDAAQTGTVTVQVIPAPGAAAMLGLGGLLTARRRRA